MNTIKKTLIASVSVALCWALTSRAADTPYAGEQARPIKSLSESDVAGLLAGQGAGLAKAAELNGYPGPAHTLELQQRLGLSPAQVTASETLMATHKARARELGASLVQAERQLDALFAKQTASAETVDQATRLVGMLQAQLRAEHLNTHLLQTALLKPEQIQRYAVLRGYSETSQKTESENSIAPKKHHH